MQKTILAAAIITLWLPSNFAYALTKTEQLQQLNSSIKHLQHNINTTHHKQRTLQQKLAANEIEAGSLARKLEHSQRQLRVARAMLKQQQKNQLYYKSRLKAEQHELTTEIQNAYMLSRNTNYLKLLLNQQDPNQISRTLNYSNYLQQARLKLIDKINSTLQRIEQNQKNITAETNRLVALEAKEQHELQHLVISKKTRAALLHKIDAKLKTEQQKLHKQKTDKKNLAKIINRLKSSTIATEFTANLKHPHKKLSWPTNGKIENLYGSKIMHSQLKWSGVLIQAPEGRAVHAVATGRVVFSEWLSGYGLLIIINHGHGYMSLYGRNATLNKKVGDIVQKGTTIATVGKSGGYQHPSLYFAMRHNGNPVNPALWCR